MPLRDLDAIEAVRFRLDVWRRHLEARRHSFVLAFSLETRDRGADAHVRLFAPTAGVGEDPATGSAAGPLGVYLVRHRAALPGRWLRFEQGLEIGRPSRLEVEVASDGGEIRSLRVAGECRPVGAGSLRLPGG